MAPYQTTVMLDDTRDGQDVVEVQILPQVIINISPQYNITIITRYIFLFLIIQVSVLDISYKLLII